MDMIPTAVGQSAVRSILTFITRVVEIHLNLNRILTFTCYHKVIIMLKIWQRPANGNPGSGQAWGASEE